MTIVCSKCGQTKPIEEFHRRADRPSGHRSDCKECVRGPARQRAARWHAENREEANRKRRERGTTEQARARGRERERRRSKTPEHQEYQRKYREANRQRLQAYRREWAVANPDKIRGYTLSPEAKANRDAYVRRRKAEQQAVLDDYKRKQGCVDCGKRDGRLEFDHRVKADKSFNLGDRLGCAWDTLWAEVAKCDVRCATCHRRRHAAERVAA